MTLTPTPRHNRIGSLQGDAGRFDQLPFLRALDLGRRRRGPAAISASPSLVYTENPIRGSTWQVVNGSAPSSLRRPQRAAQPPRAAAAGRLPAAVRRGAKAMRGLRGLTRTPLGPFLRTLHTVHIWSVLSACRPA